MNAAIEGKCDSRRGVCGANAAAEALMTVATKARADDPASAGNPGVSRLIDDAVEQADSISPGSPKMKSELRLRNIRHHWRLFGMLAMCAFAAAAVMLPSVICAPPPLQAPSMHACTARDVAAADAYGVVDAVQFNSAQATVDHTVADVGW
jgi:hypothetical protein